MVSGKTVRNAQDDDGTAGAYHSRWKQGLHLCLAGNS